jgi:polysaccharide deacetylase family protein (PEP-CTERM system associated)
LTQPPPRAIAGPHLGEKAVELLPSGPPAYGATVDVEEWYHTNFRSAPALDESQLPRRADAGLERILEAMALAGARGTFFVLGCVARESPGLVRRIVEAGHEVGCHGMRHALLYEQEPAAFRDSVTDAHKLLCDLSGQPVLGFRAPSWSVTLRSLWAFDALAEAGFRYDSSVFPAANHLFGIAGAPRGPYRVTTSTVWMVEIPPAAVAFGPLRMGVGGGFYLRALPLWFQRAAMAAYSRAGSPFLLYVHPRELDPEAWDLHLPLSFTDHLIHDWHLAGVPRKVAALLGSARWEPLGEILDRRGYLSPS